MKEFYDFDLYKIPKTTYGKIIEGNKTQNTKLTILVNCDDYNEEQKVFLEKIIKSINIDFNENCVVRCFEKNENIEIGSIHNEDKCKNIISFGLDIQQFYTQANLSYSQWNNFVNFGLLIFDNLNKVKGEISLKKALWNNLLIKFNEK